MGFERVCERLDRAPGDADRRGGDQRDLEQRRQRLRLAVAEAVIVIGGRRGEADAVERDEAREQIEPGIGERAERSEEHTSELQSLMRHSYAVFCLKQKRKEIKVKTQY